MRDEFFKGGWNFALSWEDEPLVRVHVQRHDEVPVQIVTAGWRSLRSVESADGTFVFLARILFFLPSGAEAKLEFRSFDEDIVDVYWVQEHLIVICETSARVVDFSTERVRQEFGDAVISSDVFEDEVTLVFSDESLRFLKIAENGSIQLHS